MLDHSLYGTAERLSAEAPIPIVDVTEEKYQLGGAANVFNNLKALGDRPIMFGAVGDDENGSKLISLLDQNSEYEQYVFRDPSRPTTVKLRLFAQSRQVSRADFESCEPLSDDMRIKIVSRFAELAPTLSAVVIEDYNKGLLPTSVIKEILEIAHRAKVTTLVDPKFDNFFSYKNVSLFKPNLRELSKAIGKTLFGDKDIEAAVRDVRHRLACQNVMVTLGKDGIALLASDDSYMTLPASVRVVNDPAGAGDTVISVMASAMAGGGKPAEAMGIANFGGGLICEKLGIQTITLGELESAVRRYVGV